MAVRLTASTIIIIVSLFQDRSAEKLAKSGELFLIELESQKNFE
jgi:hypothetical protein